MITGGYTLDLHCENEAVHGFMWNWSFKESAGTHIGESDKSPYGGSDSPDCLVPRFSLLSTAMTEYEQLASIPQKELWELPLDEILKASTLRETLVARFAWAIPNEEALAAIEKAAKGRAVVEMGAGKGYWAKLLQDRGLTVLPFDKKKQPDAWTTVKKGTPKILTRHSDKVLFLCWPSYDDPMAHDCLKYWKGDTLIYVGEGNGGCTADDAFHASLDKYFTRLRSVGIPQFPGIHDNLTVYQRKQVRLRAVSRPKLR